MIITFDGLSGAGKTTQAVKIAKLLKLPNVSFDGLKSISSEMCSLLTGDYGYSTFSGILRDLAVFRSMQLGPKGWGSNFVLADNFFRILFPFRDSSEINELVYLFRKCLCFGGGREPVASFYLHMEPNERELRRLSRLSVVQQS